MYKQDVTYTDYDGNEQTDTLYFHIDKLELIKNLELRDEAENLLEQMQSGEEGRNLEQAEMRKLFAFVEKIAELGYGERESSKKFNKSPEIFKAWKSSPSYSQFIFDLFQNPGVANAFMRGLMPSDLRAQVDEELNKNQLTLPKVEEAPRGLPTRAELEAMSPEDFKKALNGLTPEEYSNIMHPGM